MLSREESSPLFSIILVWAKYKYDASNYRLKFSEVLEFLNLVCRRQDQVHLPLQLLLQELKLLDLTVVGYDGADDDVKLAIAALILLKQTMQIPEVPIEPQMAQTLPPFTKNFHPHLR